MKTALFILLAAVAVMAGSNDTMTAKVDYDGVQLIDTAKVVLYPDGTWHYYDIKYFVDRNGKHFKEIVTYDNHYNNPKIKEGLTFIIKEVWTPKFDTGNW